MTGERPVSGAYETVKAEPPLCRPEGEAFPALPSPGWDCTKAWSCWINRIRVRDHRASEIAPAT